MTISGASFLKIALSLKTTSRISLLLGISYIVSSIAASKIALKPLAPVFFSKAFLAAATKASLVNLKFTPYNPGLPKELVTEPDIFKAMTKEEKGFG